MSVEFKPIMCKKYVDDCFIIFKTKNNYINL